ncbi:hypothetical protein ZWY2020_021125 [Hordeum vulgare]|nr:hypothetical protein ZWY2020_021125 [Hordeum vulgare]
MEAAAAAAVRGPGRNGALVPCVVGGLWWSGFGGVGGSARVWTWASAEALTVGRSVSWSSRPGPGPSVYTVYMGSRSEISTEAAMQKPDRKRLDTTG